ncbi:BolA domain protein [Paramyrothecium foliicola]|nr:BolA domain protein [Paramyrothecium foliicola]
MSSNSSVEEVIRAKITAALNPRTLEIYNDSHLHAHHKAMEGSTSGETHFRYTKTLPKTTSGPLGTCYLDLYAISLANTGGRLVIISDAFKSKMQPARHRMVYALLTEEMAREGGIHALQLRTLTPEEQEVQDKKRQQLAAEKELAKAQAAAEREGA